MARTLVGLDIAAAYVCRTVNYAEKGKLSEHARGGAIDISRFRRADGSVVDVREDWGPSAPGRLLRRLHAGACGPFGTALGPDADRHHRDHFHFDVAKRRRAFCQ